MLPNLAEKVVRPINPTENEMITANVHISSPKVKITCAYHAPTRDCGEYAIVEINQNGDSVTLFFRESVDLLSFISDTSNLHARWLEAKLNRECTEMATDMGNPVA